MYIQTRFNYTSLQTSERNIVLNTVVEKRNSVANFICLITKQYIYAQKCLGNTLSFECWKNKVHQVENIEKYIAIKNKKSYIHEKKWHKKNMGESQTLDYFIERYVMQM